jgi:hypothetical protein
LRILRKDAFRWAGQVVGAPAAGDSLSQSAAIAQDKFVAVEGDVEARTKNRGGSCTAALIGLLIGKMS